LLQRAFDKELNANAARLDGSPRSFVITCVTCNACGFDPNELAAD